MNTEWVRDNLIEAIEQLQQVVDAPADYDSQEELDIAFAHAYFHINCAYNGAFSDDPSSMPKGEDSWPLRYFPVGLEEVYGTWTKE